MSFKHFLLKKGVTLNATRTRHMSKKVHISIMHRVPSNARLTQKNNMLFWGAYQLQCHLNIFYWKKVVTLDATRTRHMSKKVHVSIMYCVSSNARLTLKNNMSFWGAYQLQCHLNIFLLKKGSDTRRDTDTTHVQKGPHFDHVSCTIQCSLNPKKIYHFGECINYNVLIYNIYNAQIIIYHLIKKMCDVLNPTNILNIESYFFIRWCVIIETLQKLYIKPLQHICSRHFKFYLNHISKLIINFNYVLFCSSDFIFVVLSLIGFSFTTATHSVEDLAMLPSLNNVVSRLVM